MLIPYNRPGVFQENFIQYLEFDLYNSLNFIPLKAGAIICRRKGVVVVKGKIPRGVITLVLAEFIFLTIL